MTSHQDAKEALHDLAVFWISAQADVSSHVLDLAKRCTELVELQAVCTPEQAREIARVVEAIQDLLLCPGEEQLRQQLSRAFEQLDAEAIPSCGRSEEDLTELDPKAIRAFLDDRIDSLNDLDDEALEYEQTGKSEALASIKRILHSIKGDASILGLTEVSEHCHAVEDQLVGASQKAVPGLISAAVNFLRARFNALIVSTGV